MANDYLQEILSGQNQRKVTGQGALTPRQVEAAFKGELSARYEAEARNRSLALQQRSIENQESQYASTLELQKDQLSAQKQGEMVSAGITGLGVTAYAAPKLMAAFGGGAAGGIGTGVGIGTGAGITSSTLGAGSALAGTGTLTSLGVGGTGVASTFTAGTTGGLLTGAGTGASTGAEVGSTIGPWGTAIGAVVGVVVGVAAAAISKNSWICTQINIRFGILKENLEALSKLRRYSIKNHRADAKAYFMNGYKLTDVINDDGTYDALQHELVGKCCDLVRQGNMEEAFLHYREVTLRLCSEYGVDLSQD